MRTYRKQYGGRSFRHLVYHWVEESWYQELSQICHSARAYVLMNAYAYALVKPGLRVKWSRHATREHRENIRFPLRFLASNNKINKNT